jgi:transcriptional regulator with GAF, ATPase, and Fis domain
MTEPELGDVIVNLVVLILGKAGAGKEALTQTLREGSVGDVRELATLLEQLADPHAPEAVATSGAPSGAALPSEGLDLKAHMERIEVELIRQALARADGVVAHAANTLGLRRTTLVEKLRKYGLGREGVNGAEPSQPAAH